MNLPHGAKNHIATFLDTLSLCFFAKTGRDTLASVQPELKARYLTDYIKLFAGDYLSFLYTNKTILGWSNTFTGQPALADIIKDGIAKIISKEGVNFILTLKGMVYAFGRSRRGQLGLPSRLPVVFPTLITSLPFNIIDISNGHDHSLFLTKSGKVYACGSNTDGKLGLVNKSFGSAPQLITHLNSLKIVKVIAGKNHSFAITDKGQVYAWGNNQYGELGLGNTVTQCTPKLVDNLPEPIVNIIAVECDTFFISQTGKTYACGFNNFSTLGLNHGNPQLKPIEVNGLTGKIIKIVRHFNQKYFLLDTNELYYSSESEFIFGLEKFAISVSITEMDSTGEDMFILTSRGELYEKGLNSYGQLGLKDKKRYEEFTLMNTIEEPIAQVSLSKRHSLILTRDNRLYVCGSNEYNQLGLENCSTQSIPTELKTKEIKQILSQPHQLLFLKNLYENPPARKDISIPTKEKVSHKHNEKAPLVPKEDNERKTKCCSIM